MMVLHAVQTEICDRLDAAIAYTCTNISITKHETPNKGVTNMDFHSRNNQVFKTFAHTCFHYLNLFQDSPTSQIIIKAC